jgi:hypothetical protein
MTVTPLRLRAKRNEAARELFYPRNPPVSPRGRTHRPRRVRGWRPAVGPWPHDPSRRRPPDRAHRASGPSLPRLASPIQYSHGLQTLFAQRTYRIACAYEDGNDANARGADPLFKLSLERRPLDEAADLASAPTLSPLENAATPRALDRVADAFVDQFIATSSISALTAWQTGGTMQVSTPARTALQVCSGRNPPGLSGFRGLLDSLASHRFMSRSVRKQGPSPTGHQRMSTRTKAAKFSIKARKKHCSPLLE